MLDPVRNLAIVTLSSGYDLGATSVVLNTGHGAKLPDPATEGAFNLVWWNASDYASPADDPNAEIVRCTARAVDTLTIARAQEGTASSNHNITGKIYRMILSVTKRTIDQINEGNFLKIEMANRTLTQGAGVLFKNTSQYAVEVDSGQNLSLMSLDFKNNEVTQAGSFFWGISINCDFDAVDTGGAIGVTNSGKADTIYLNVRGKPGVVSNNTPTGLAVELNRGIVSGENSTTFGGFGIQIYDQSSTDIGLGGPTGIFLKKQSNPNTQHVLLEMLTNRDAMRIMTTAVGTYDATGALITIWDTDGFFHSGFRADGQIYFANNYGALFTGLGGGSLAGIKCDTANPSWLCLNGGVAGTRILNNAWDTNLMMISNAGLVSIGNGVGDISDGTVGLDIDGKIIRLRQSKTPASATATGKAGEFCWDASYFYMCVATNTWRRAAHASW